MAPRPSPLTPVERVLARCVRTDDGCLLWTGATIRGYGAIKIGGRSGETVYTHRVVWEVEHGPIPDGLTIDHVVCAQPLCQETAHMELVTRAENARRQGARRTHCKWGHSLEPGNLVKRSYGRMCATCHRERQLRYYHEGRRR